ncbi:MAG: Mov34/MPN/PAD-1 family protein [Chloroflexi bacterium]|nr:Mov34/MPN/PAD-1 family protein [Chloroflexota bacterium]
MLDPWPRLITPTPTRVSAVRVEAPRPAGLAVAVDIHSHQAMPAFFSATDNRSDAGLGVSAVIGTIDTVPTIRCRLNLDGWHQEIGVTRLFAGPGPFVDLVDRDEQTGRRPV